MKGPARKGESKVFSDQMPKRYAALGGSMVVVALVFILASNTNARPYLPSEPYRPTAPPSPPLS
jgi:hypothetical protein